LIARGSGTGILVRVQDIQVGAVYRAVRRRQGLSQREIAARAGVSQQTVSVIERGRFDEVDLATLRRVGAVLGIDLPFAPRWRGPELDRLLDAGHAAIVEIVVGELRDRGWTVMVEWSFNRYGERGSVDVLAWHPDRSALVVVEVKTRVVDLQGLLGTLDRKVRIAAEILRKNVAGDPLQSRASSSCRTHRPRVMRSIATARRSMLLCLAVRSRSDAGCGYPRTTSARSGFSDPPAEPVGRLGRRSPAVPTPRVTLGTSCDSPRYQRGW
jgi:transcriptional regulator with XRE-family HTH domain